MKTNNTTTTATTTSTEGFASLYEEALSPRPPAKKHKLLVDNLRHVHDHGLAVEFTDEALKKWVLAITSFQNKKLTFHAGETTLTILRNGRVTRTYLRPGRGASSTRIHYYCPTLKIKATIREAETGFHYLNYLIFGVGNVETASSTRLRTPYTIERHGGFSGTSQNLFRADLRNSGGWWLLGESGLRAFAVQKSLIEPLAASLKTAETAQTNLTHTLSQFKGRNWNAMLTRISDKLKENTKQLKNSLSLLESSRTEKDPEKLRYLGVGRQWVWETATKKLSPCKYGFPAVPEVWSHPCLSPNYKVSLSSDGESFILSSGIKCPISVREAIAWLEGKAPAPRTVYGEVKVVDARNDLGEPVRIVTCGCHRLDLLPLGEKFASLLAPKHKVKKTGAKPETVMNGTAKERRAFYSELRRRIAIKIREAHDHHDFNRQELIQSRAALKHEMKNREATEARLTEELAAACKQVEKARAELEAVSEQTVVSPTLKQVNEMAVAICNILIGVPAEMPKDPA